MKKIKEIDVKNVVKEIIFASKWLLIPFYLKLFWTLTKLLYHFFDGHGLQNSDLMDTLEDVDITMVANLVKMIITGSYNSFVDKYHGVEGEQVSSGALKVKMSTSIMGVSSIHLLKTFLAENANHEVMYRQIVIHCVFIVGAFVLAVIDYLHCKSEVHTDTKEIPVGVDKKEIATHVAAEEKVLELVKTSH